MRYCIKSLLHGSFLTVSKRWREEKVTFFTLPLKILSFLLNGTYCWISCFPCRKVLICKRPCVHAIFFSFFGCFNCCCNLHILQRFRSKFSKRPQEDRGKSKTAFWWVFSGGLVTKVIDFRVVSSTVFSIWMAPKDGHKDFLLFLYLFLCHLLQPFFSLTSHEQELSDISSWSCKNPPPILHGAHTQLISSSSM